jgi:hypothetical protein
LAFPASSPAIWRNHPLAKTSLAFWVNETRKQIRATKNTERGTLTRDNGTGTTKFHQLPQHATTAHDRLLSRFFIRSADEVGEQVISGDSDQSATTVGINDPHRLAHTPSVI